MQSVVTEGLRGGIFLKKKRHKGMLKIIEMAIL
jgi:hypothetical protein